MWGPRTLNADDDDESSAILILSDLLSAMTVIFIQFLLKFKVLY